MRLLCAFSVLAVGVSVACTTHAEKTDAAQTARPSAAPAGADAAPPASQTAGFDGARAFEYLKAQVAFGPRPSGSPALARTQEYIKGQLASFGCAVDEDNFTAQT